jgi:hypothetical protein
MPFDPGQLTPEIAASIEAGIAEGTDQVVAMMFENPASDRNGWIHNTDVGYADNERPQRAFYRLKGVLGPVRSLSHRAANCLKYPKQRHYWLPPHRRMASTSPPASTTPTRR